MKKEKMSAGIKESAGRSPKKILRPSVPPFFTWPFFQTDGILPIFAAMQQLSPAELKEWMDTGKDFFLLDIREDWEREAFNIAGAHIPMGQLMEHLSELPKNKPLVIYCEKGIRSTITIQRLEEKGFTGLYNLAGGMKAWKAS